MGGGTSESGVEVGPEEEIKVGVKVEVKVKGG